MPNIARKLVSGVGFSNGCALLALKKPPPLVPNCLMISCDATGPCAIVCSRTTVDCGFPSAPVVVMVCGSTTATLSYGLKFCTTPCETRNSAPTIADRQQHPERGPDHVDPEVADRVLLRLGDAADERDRHRDADRRRHEVVVGEPGHLREIAHGRFAAVGLPVGVGRERHRGVEREGRRDRPEPLRIERQHVPAAAASRRAPASTRR